MSTWRWWLAYGVLSLTLLGFLGVLTRAAWEVEGRAEKNAAQIEQQQHVQQALWRMDALLAPMVAREAARPAEVFHAESDPKLVNPLWLVDEPEITLHASASPGQMWCSVQSGNTLNSDVAANSNELLAALNQRVPSSLAFAVLPQDTPVTPPPVVASLVVDKANQQVEPLNSSANSADFGQRGLNYYNSARSQQVSQIVSLSNDVNRNGSPEKIAEPKAPPENLLPETPLLRPRWLAGELLLLRRVQVDKRDQVQVVWLNWPRLRSHLLEQVHDLLPAAEVRQLTMVNDSTLRLATLPVELLPGPLPASAAIWSPLSTALLLAWGTAVLALGGGAWLLAAGLALSRRRERFVSAVTHELRTPLTSLRLNSDLLADDLVSDPADRALLLGSVREQAGRLAHLVDNVLAFARLERRPATVPAQCTLGQVFERCRSPLLEISTRGKLQVELPSDAALLVQALYGDAQAVERIVVNLLDNAAKYAPASRVMVDVQSQGKYVLVRVRDHGPGVPRALRPRLFTPFATSSADAAESGVPGVGLGLALARDLARQQGGDLRYADAQPGAMFTLSLKRAG